MAENVEVAIGRICWVDKKHSLLRPQKTAATAGAGCIVSGHALSLPCVAKVVSCLAVLTLVLRENTMSWRGRMHVRQRTDVSHACQAQQSPTDCVALAATRGTAAQTRRWCAMPTRICSSTCRTAGARRRHGRLRRRTPWLPLACRPGPPPGRCTQVRHPNLNTASLFLARLL